MTARLVGLYELQSPRLSYFQEMYSLQMMILQLLCAWSLPRVEDGTPAEYLQLELDWARRFEGPS